VLHHSLNLNMLVNLIPLRWPMETMCRLLGSSALKPTKQPATVVFSCLRGGGVMVMFDGTWVRIGWLLARNVEFSSFMVGMELTLERVVSFTVVKLGAMVLMERKVWEFH